MPLQDHSLVKDFPEMKEKIHDLKSNNNHFAKLFAQYDEVEHNVHRIESGAEASSDERLNELKSKRANLKDELFAILKQAA